MPRCRVEPSAAALRGTAPHGAHPSGTAPSWAALRRLPRRVLRALAQPVRCAALAASLVAGALPLLAGCDQERIEKLEEGVSTEADVRRQFGEPAAVFDEPGGGRTLDYPRQPEGQKNYMVTLGPDGVMTSLRQVLTAANLARVQPGMTRDEVRRLLGRPAKVARYALKPGEETWNWRWADGPQARAFDVVFGADGRVVSSAVGDDTKNTDR